MPNLISKIVLPRQLVLGAKAIINDKDSTPWNEYSQSKYKLDRLYDLLGLEDTRLPGTKYAKRFEKKIASLAELSGLSTPDVEVNLKELVHMSGVIKDKYGAEPKYH